MEASQLEKRACDEFLAHPGEQERLEVLRHRERQAAGLQEQLEEAKLEAEALRRSLAQRNAQLEELEEQIKMWMEKNDAKQEVRSDSTLMSADGPENHQEGNFGEKEVKKSQV